MEMGLSVPKGIVVTRQALSLFLEQTGLLPMARRLIDGNRVNDAARATDLVRADTGFAATRARD
jgi:phosphoenolpyruvate synthase/pyruvate phosphate dikinase